MIASENNTKQVSCTNEGFKKMRTTIMSMRHKKVNSYGFITYVINHVLCPCTIAFIKKWVMRVEEQKLVCEG